MNNNKIIDKIINFYNSLDDMIINDDFKNFLNYEIEKSTLKLSDLIELKNDLKNSDSHWTEQCKCKQITDGWHIYTDKFEYVFKLIDFNIKNIEDSIESEKIKINNSTNHTYINNKGPITNGNYNSVNIKTEDNWLQKIYNFVKKIIKYF